MCSAVSNGVGVGEMQIAKRSVDLESEVFRGSQTYMTFLSVW